MFCGQSAMLQSRIRAKVRDEFEPKDFHRPQRIAFMTLAGRIERYFPFAGSQSPQPRSKVSLSDLPCDILIRIFSEWEYLHHHAPIELNLAQCWVSRRFDDDQPGFKGDELHGICEFWCRMEFNARLNEADDQVSNMIFLADTYYLSCPQFDCRNLFLCSPSMTEAVSHVLYSKNRFEVRRSGPGGFKPLFALGARNISFLTFLRVYLDIPPPSNRSCLCYECYSDSGARPIRYSSNGKPLGHACWPSRCSCTIQALGDWQKLCAFLAAHVVPGRLKLVLEADVRNERTEKIDYDLAQEIIDALAKVPRLADCSVRLSAIADTELRNQCSKAEDKVTGRNTETFSLFKDLPIELREHILSFTGLVAPHDLLYSLDSNLEPLCFWRRYSTIASGASSSNPDYDELDFEDEYMMGAGSLRRGFCGCPRCDTEYGCLLPSECPLWHFPKELFYVSHNISQLSRRIFFTQNRCVLISGKYMVKDNLEIEHVRNYAPVLWTRFRRLEYILRTSLQEHDHDPSCRYWPIDWWKMVSLLKKAQEGGQFAPEQLDLSVTICYATEASKTVQRENEALKDLGVRAIAPLLKLDDIHRLRSFRILYDWTVLCEPNDQQKAAYGLRMKDCVNWLESCLEKRVMGAEHKGLLGEVSSRDEARHAWREKMKAAQRPGVWFPWAIS